MILPLSELSKHSLTSRSAIETYQRCNRKRYLQYFYNGIGIVAIRPHIALVSGIETHYGVGEILLDVKRRKGVIAPDSIDLGIGLAKDHYLTTNNLSGPGLELDSQQQYTKKEQLALIEALIRCWSLIELPRIVERYNIIDVERELLYPLTDSILLQSKCDTLLQEKGTKNYYIYSLKTTKGYWYKTERNYKKDLQGVTEILAIEEWFKEQNHNLKQSINGLSLVEVGSEIEKIRSYLDKQLLPEKVMGVKFCFLVKGDRRDKSKPWGWDKEAKEVNGQTNSNDVGVNNSNWVTDSPLLYGYKKFTPTSIEYAHSDKTIKPENKSGFGKLGKGWEEFRVWEEEGIGGIKGWVEKIFTGSVQPELGNILEKIVVCPVEYFRNQEELEDRRLQIIGIENDCFTRAQSLHCNPVLFPQNTGSCHYPVDCEYLPICFLEEPYTGKPVPPNVRDNPIESGLFVRRIPHHEPERVLVQLQGNAKE